ncbi:hypothetical protein [Actinoplanes sp. M2I2]|uniref:hypothetical protein n=1 Tax=Actinoplanes sp. M2I2 TaxID=1734444 RepID=UPI002020EF72|nr:hypothetical protein [Actinoplanes sp. M2I2]
MSVAHFRMHPQFHLPVYQVDDPQYEVPAEWIMALDNVKATLTDGVSSALSDVAEGIIVFWTGLIIALVALVGGIIGALASATVVGLPAGPFIAAGAALTASAAMIAGGETLKSVCAAANSTLRQKIADNSGFHQGHWPPAATGV